jgi:predicted nuclease with RNAse H fold
MKNVVYQAITLKDEITTGGCWVIEGYPYAAKVQLFSGHIPRKEMPAGIVSLRGRVAAILPGDVQP